MDIKYHTISVLGKGCGELPDFEESKPLFVPGNIWIGELQHSGIIGTRQQRRDMSVDLTDILPFAAIDRHGDSTCQVETVRHILHQTRHLPDEQALLMNGDTRCADGGEWHCWRDQNVRIPGWSWVLERYAVLRSCQPIKRKNTLHQAKRVAGNGVFPHAPANAESCGLDIQAVCQSLVLEFVDTPR